jgi:hypothetical protein
MANETVTDATAEQVTVRNFDLLLDIPLEVTVELGRTRLTLRELLGLASGSGSRAGRWWSSRSSRAKRSTCS